MYSRCWGVLKHCISLFPQSTNADFLCCIDTIEYHRWGLSTRVPSPPPNPLLVFFGTFLKCRLIKVTIHVDEQSQHQMRLQQGSAAPPPPHVHVHPVMHPVLPEMSSVPVTGVPVPPLEAPVRKTTWPVEAVTAPLTPLVAGSGSSVDDGSGNGSGIGIGIGDVAVVGHGIGTEIGNGVGVGAGAGVPVLEESEKTRRPKSMVAKRLLKTVHKRRSSLNHNRSGSFGGGLLDGKVSRTNLYSLSASASAAGGGGGPGRPPTKAEAAGGGDDELSEDGVGDASSGGEMVMGAFEGLKWGEYVQFKMPADREVRMRLNPLFEVRVKAISKYPRNQTELNRLTNRVLKIEPII